MRQLTDHIVSGDQAVQLKIDVLDEPGQGNANHFYQITGADISYNTAFPLEQHDDAGDLSVTNIVFQNGPIKEVGVNGITGEALLAIEIDRLRGFQSGPFACNANARALWHCVAALKALQERTVERIARGVEGTHKQ